MPGCQKPETSARGREPGELRQSQTTKPPDHGKRCGRMPKPGYLGQAAEPGDRRQSQTTRPPNHGERCARMPKPGITTRGQKLETCAKARPPDHGERCARMPKTWNLGQGARTWGAAPNYQTMGDPDLEKFQPGDLEKIATW